jgi:hypothetical protein
VAQGVELGDSGAHERGRVGLELAEEKSAVDRDAAGQQFQDGGELGVGGLREAATGKSNDWNWRCKSKHVDKGIEVDQ